MLTRERAERMLDAPSFADAAKLLTDCGYDDFSGLNAGEIDAALNAKRNALFDEISAACPDSAVTGVFRVKYDYHNIKVMLKSAALNLNSDGVFIRCGRFAPEKLREAYEEDSYSGLPQIMADAVKEASSVLARSSNPQLADFVLDSAMFEEMSGLAADSPFLSGYVKAVIDAANLKSCVRAVRMGKDTAFLKSVLIARGCADTDRLAGAISGEGFESVFKSTELEQAAVLADAALSGGSLTGFELACDNAMNAYLSRAKLIAYGEEPVAAYLAAMENEITAVRIILSGRLSGINPAILKERLRDFYA